MAPLFITVMKTKNGFGYKSNGDPVEVLGLLDAARVQASERLLRETVETVVADEDIANVADAT